MVFLLLALGLSAMLTDQAFRIPDGSVPADLEASMGPIQFGLIYLKRSGEPVHKIAQPVGASARLVWRDEVLQSLLGPVDVVALWTDRPPAEWTLGGAC